MKPLITTIITYAFCILINAQESLEVSQTINTSISISEKTIFYKIANTTIPIKIQQYGERTDIVYINLHDDETTSVDAAKIVLSEHGGMLIELENNLQRNISFRLGQYVYKVDPNTIFSREGIKKSLEQLGRTSQKAIDEIARLGERILELIPEKTKCIVALHNNTPALFSATDYTLKNKRSSDSRKVYLNPEEDTDDFFLTTDSYLYENLADKRFNTILQDNKKCAEDGSLSVYCGKKNIRYVNCETEHGKTDQYYDMLTQLTLILNNKN